MKYVDTLTLKRASATASDGMGGLTGSGETTVYSGPADVQDNAVVFRLGQGTVRDEGDATAYLPVRLTAFDVRMGDYGTAEFQGGPTVSVTVARIDQLDDSVVLRYDQ